MKKSIFSFLVSAFVIISFYTHAQSPIDKMFEKYAGQDGYTSVNISKDMIQMFAGMGDDKDTSTQEMHKMMNQLTGLKVLSCNADSTKPAKALAFYNEASYKAD